MLICLKFLSSFLGRHRNLGINVWSHTSSQTCLLNEMILVRILASFHKYQKREKFKIISGFYASVYADVLVCSLMLSYVCMLDDDAQQLCFKHWCSFKIFQFRFWFMSYELDSYESCNINFSLFFFILQSALLNIFPERSLTIIRVSFKDHFLPLHFICRSWSWSSLDELSRLHGAHC